MHNHVLPCTDRPLVTQNLVGGEDGLADAGISLVAPDPEPRRSSSRPRARSTAASRTSSRRPTPRRPRLRRPPARATATSPSPPTSTWAARSPTATTASDRTTTTRLVRRRRHVPLPAAAPRDLHPLPRPHASSSWSRRERAGGRRATPSAPTATCEYQFAPPLVRGRALRPLRARRRRLASRDKGGSLLLTYWPSEFSQIRGQYRHTHLRRGPTANEFLFQFLFSIGAHGAHPF